MKTSRLFAPALLALACLVAMPAAFAQDADSSNTSVVGQIAVSNFQVTRPAQQSMMNQQVRTVPARQFAASMSFSFNPDVQNLSGRCLGVSPRALSDAEQADVLSRMPADAQVAFDPAFAVMVTVSPDASCGFSFTNTVEVELHTSNLTYGPNSPYRVYKSPVGGAFHDITSEVLPGSVRARGRGGAFSQFVLVKDLSQDYANQVSYRFDDLNDAFFNAFKQPPYQMNQAFGGRPGPGAAAAADLAAAQDAFNSADYTGAASSLQAFESDVASLAGNGALANRWQPGQVDQDNPAGDMMSRSAHVRFLLGRLSGQ